MQYYIGTAVSYLNSGYFLGFPSGQNSDRRDQQTINLLFSRDGIHWDVISEKFMGDLCQVPERFVPQILVSPDNTKNLLYVNHVSDSSVSLYTIRKNGLASLKTIDNQRAYFITYPFFINRPYLKFNYRLLNSQGYLEVDVYRYNHIDQQKDLESDQKLEHF